VSTYLTVLALRKPLIISSVASTIGILDEKTAVLVPAGDPLALRAAILRLDADPDLRASLADAGSRYAAQTGDTSRLHSDYLRHLLKLAGASMGEPAGGDLPQSPMPASEPRR